MTHPGKTLEEIHRAERDKWDALARQASDGEPSDATFEEVAEQGALLQGVAPFLGDLRGRQVLEYGCGLGQFTVLLARSGAHVTSFDLSPGAVDYTRRRAAREGVADRVRLVVGPAEDLPFDDESFDVVFGKAILHHIDPALGPPELRRVMRAGALAAFSEPLGMNPVLNLVRDHVPYPEKNPRGDDRPLTRADLNAWTSGFSRADVRGIHLLSMLERGLGFGRRLSTLRRIDALLLRRFPALTRYCRYALLLLER
jgi:SAM-dependent methyltransferase